MIWCCVILCGNSAFSLAKSSDTDCALYTFKLVKLNYWILWWTNFSPSLMWTHLTWWPMNEAISGHCTHFAAVNCTSWIIINIFNWIICKVTILYPCNDWKVHLFMHLNQRSIMILSVLTSRAFGIFRFFDLQKYYSRLVARCINSISKKSVGEWI